MVRNVEGLKFFLKNTIFDVVLYDTDDHKKYAVAGGAVRDYLSNNPIKDIDIFCEDIEAEEYILDRLQSLADFGHPDIVYVNHNDFLSNYRIGEYAVQIIRNKYFPLTNDPSFLIEAFDFTICGGMVRFDGEAFFLPTFFQDCLAKHLRIQVITFPLSTLERMQKYIQRGYTACNGTLLSIAKSLQGLDYDNPDVNTLVFYPDGTPRFFSYD